MNRVIKIILIIFIFCFIIFFVPLLINVLFKVNFNIPLLQSEWTAGDALNFYGSVLSFIGTITLGTISVWQTKKANNLQKNNGCPCLFLSVLFPAVFLPIPLCAVLFQLLASCLFLCTSLNPI